MGFPSKYWYDLPEIHLQIFISRDLHPNCDCSDFAEIVKSDDLCEICGGKNLLSKNEVMSALKKLLGQHKSE